MELNIDRKKLRLNFENQTIDVYFPNGEQIENFEKEIKDADDKGIINKVYLFLSELGLPKEISKKMDFMTLTEVMEILSGKKKL